jgi:carbamoyl-phosphate synthase small subunit
MNEATTAVLVLENGSVYKGLSAGMIGTTTGEICFNTGMTGYQEIFTDPSYFGQVMVTTNAHIGNYGVKKQDEESEKVQISGLVCKNFTNEYSRKMADQDLQSYFEDNKIVCIHGVDTRAIVKEIRDAGAMNAIISSEIEDISKLKLMLKEVPSMDGLELASKVTTQEAYFIGNPESDIKIAVFDFGTKKNILNCLASRGAYLKVFPAKSSFSEVSEFNPDGYFLSNGPGDPAAMDYAIATVKEILKTRKPIFGICLGHQLLALASDVPTYKMHQGHRGINHPVINKETGRCEITSQNHGFGVDMDVLATREDIIVTHYNLNDKTVEGIRLRDQDAFSVQYHPEAAPGPHDSRYLFDQFINTIKQSKNN